MANSYLSFLLLATLISAGVCRENSDESVNDEYSKSSQEDSSEEINAEINRQENIKQISGIIEENVSNIHELDDFGKENASKTNEEIEVRVVEQSEQLMPALIAKNLENEEEIPPKNLVSDVSINKNEEFHPKNAKETSILTEELKENFSRLLSTLTPEDKLKKIQEASNKVASLVQSELEKLTSINQAPQRTKRDINDSNMQKFLYSMENGEDLIDMIPDADTNQVEIKNLDDNSTLDGNNVDITDDIQKDKTETPIKFELLEDDTSNVNTINLENPEEKSDVLPELIDHGSTFYNQDVVPKILVIAPSPEPEVFTQEMTDDVESETIEKEGEPKVTHMSRSTRYRLSQTAVPHYLNNMQQLPTQYYYDPMYYYPRF